MAEALTLEIVTPERIAFKGVVQEVTIPGTEGEFGVLRGHTALLAAVGEGELSFQQEQGQGRVHFAVHQGYAEVTSALVTVLVECAERSDMINLDRARRAKERAEEELRKFSQNDIACKKAQLALQRAVTRINVVKGGVSFT
ncbi:MAG: F0F1 ATP synthase subunit epsilon [Syntrophaceae bacterium]|nr:F0F1 ATP synthase subunit epsilon [Syntrophaceae bacterium]